MGLGYVVVWEEKPKVSNSTDKIGMLLFGSVLLLNILMSPLLFVVVFVNPCLKRRNRNKMGNYLSKILSFSTLLSFTGFVCSICVLSLYGFAWFNKLFIKHNHSVCCQGCCVVDMMKTAQTFLNVLF